MFLAGLFEPAVSLLDTASAQESQRGGGSYLDELLARAQRYLDGKPRDAAKAAEILAQAASAGSGEAMLILAGLYATGDGVPANFDQAKAMYQGAIAAGVSGLDTAWAGLGDLYNKADEKHRDPARAVEAYQKAADLGNTAVLVNLATLLATGGGGSADLSRAADLLEKATEAKDPNAAAAWVTLGDLFRSAGNSAKAVDAYQRSIDLGVTTSLVTLGQMVGAGEGIPPDFDRAKKLFDAAIALGGDSQNVAWAALGDLYLDSDADHRNFARAAEAFQRAIDLGNTKVLVNLAQIVALGGDGLPVDFERAQKLLEQAASLGGEEGTTAWVALGNLYRYADDAHRDLTKAAEAYAHAAAAGDVSAMINLARMEAGGEGVPVDFDGARTLLENAIAAGHGTNAWAWATLGDLYRNADTEHQDLAAAADAYKKGADLGDTGAMLHLATMLASGDGVSADFAQARALLEKVIAAGGENVVLAWGALGDLYASGGPGQRDDGKAIEAYLNRAQLDNDSATWEALGDLYSRGAPGYRDEVRAVDAYQRAADGGRSTALLKLALVLDPSQFDQAKALLEKAIDAKDSTLPAAEVALGDLYLNADDAHRDPAAAADAYRKAADTGNIAGMIKLARMLAGGDGIETDFDAARQLLEQATASPDPGSAAWAWGTLGDLYRYAEPDRRDLAKAVDAYRHAAEERRHRLHGQARRAASRRRRCRPGFRPGQGLARQGGCRRKSGYAGLGVVDAWRPLCERRRRQGSDEGRRGVPEGCRPRRRPGHDRPRRDARLWGRRPRRPRPRDSVVGEGRFRREERCGGLERPRRSLPRSRHIEPAPAQGRRRVQTGGRPRQRIGHDQSRPDRWLG